MKTLITIQHPVTGTLHVKDVTELSPRELDFLAAKIDGVTLGKLLFKQGTPGEWLAAYVDLVGPVEAGKVIFG